MIIFGMVRKIKKATKNQTKTRRINRSAASKIKLMLVPHALNNYQPHLIRNYGIVIVVIFVVAIQAFSMVLSNNQILGEGSNALIQQLFINTNQQRENNSLPALKLDDKLSAAAEKKAKDMIAVGYWSHNAPDGTTPWKWITNEDYKYAYAGENLARGFSNGTDIIHAWMNSETHRANVLGAEYSDIGLAAVNGIMDGKNTTVVVAMYASPVGAPNTAGNDTARTLASQAETDMSLWARIQYAIQSMSPALVITFILLGAVIIVLIVSYIYRKKLPKRVRYTIKYRMYGIYKIAIAVAGAFASILAYGSGGII